MSIEDIKTPLILSDNIFPVVGIGASAGGLKAFQDFIQAIPTNSGMAYILIQHLAPDHESILPDILQNSTAIPVVEITDNVTVFPDHIYVIPSNKLLYANDGKLKLTSRLKKGKIQSIDLFFTSLAEVHQAHSIGIILSGTGNDGTLGLQAIKNAGGITMAQDEDSSASFAMPQNAIAADVVDYILTPREMPERLQQVAGHGQTREATGAALGGSEDELLQDKGFSEIINLLKEKQGVDFTHYKQTTVRRRILRRKGLLQIAGLEEYKNFVMEDKAEQDALLKDMLIPVTAFFRDPKCFELLKRKVFPSICKGKKITDPVRIWVTGCSTGEEAYSIAISIHEYFTENKKHYPVQIFATDIASASITKARSGVYTIEELEGISETQLGRYFTKVKNEYHVNKSIRELIVFAVQNFITDPPFSKIDLLSCRNVLIYMEAYLQKKAFKTFHYSLARHGFLLLGKSETPGIGSNEFIAYNKQQNIYTRNPAIDTPTFDITGPTSNIKKSPVEKDSKRVKEDIQKSVDDAILASFTKSGVVINEQLDIIQFKGSTGDYLEAPSGRVNHNILKMAREGLSFELKNALHKVKLTNKNFSKKNIQLARENRRVNINIIPLKNTIEPYWLVLFENSLPEPATISNNTKTGKKNTGSTPEKIRIAELENELIQGREDMRAITADQESANEELQSANEELLSGTEELQSLNEELETTKEEIQSSNEELTVLNHELIERNEQLTESRNYAEAVVSTMHEPLVVLTRNMHIKSANASFYKKFNVDSTDTKSRSFFEINKKQWVNTGLRDMLEKVFEDQVEIKNLEIKIITDKQKPVHLLLNARQLLNSSVNEELILLAMSDITVRKELEIIQTLFSNELEKQVKERTIELKNTNINLQYANENLQQFAAIASHDLQEPLRKIKVFTSILNKHFADGASQEAKDVVGKIKLASDRMSQLIKEVLEYSTVAYGAKEFVPVDLDQVLKNVLSDIDLLLSETRGEINYKKALPVIDAIPLQMHQLFYNLMTNALKFCKTGQQPIITIDTHLLTPKEKKQFSSLQQNAAYVDIVFSDQGIGFDNQFAEQIFQIFEKLHTTETYEGTGVGLAICKKISENHHGLLYAHAVENSGATFHIVLPVKQ